MLPLGKNCHLRLALIFINFIMSWNDITEIIEYIETTGFRERVGFDEFCFLPFPSQFVVHLYDYFFCFFLCFFLNIFEIKRTVFKSPHLNQDRSVDCDKENKIVRVTIVVIYLVWNSINTTWNPLINIFSIFITCNLSFCTFLNSSFKCGISTDVGVPLE